METQETDNTKVKKDEDFLSEISELSLSTITGDIS